MHRSCGRTCRALVVVVAALALPGPAKAGIVLLTNPNQFSGTETLLTFTGVQPFQNVTSFGGVGFQYVGQPAGSGLSGAIDLSPPREFGPLQDGAVLNQFQFGTQGVRLTFPSSINRLAFEFRSIPNAGGVLSLDLFSSGTPVDSFTIPNRETNTGGLGTYFFYGFESDTLFDQVVLRGPGDGRFQLDNLRFENAAVAVIPEPGTLTLLGLGAFGLLAHRWRRRRGG